MDAKILLPKKRFKKFKDDGIWKNLSMKEVSTLIVAGGDIDRNKIKKSGKYPVLANALTNSGVVGYYDGDYRIKAPAVTITGRGDVGHAKAREINFTPVVRLLAIKSNHDIHFLENAINKIAINIESTGVPQLTAPQLGKVEINLPPTINEEKLIGKFISKLNKQMYLQQQKITKLKDLKSGYLNDMFPKEGESVPKLRFADFNEDWKRVFIGDISDMYQPKTIGRNVLSDSGVPVFGANGYIGYYFKSNHKSDQVTISARGENSGNPSYVIGPVWITGNSMVINVDNRNICKFFLYNLLLTLPLKTYVTGGAQPQITREILKSVPLSLPGHSEQIKIGEFFRNLDSQIKLQEDKLEKLKQMKQAYLNEMFV